jgi:hypothetical protein
MTEQREQQMSVSEHLDAPHDNHGNSPAAWTAVTIMIIGSVVCAAAFPLISVGVGVLGVLIIIGGLVIGKVMSMAGYGSLPAYTVEEPSPTKFEGPTLDAGHREEAEHRTEDDHEHGHEHNEEQGR